MFWQMLQVEQHKIYKRAILWIELAVLAVLVIGLYTILFATVQAGGGEMTPEAVDAVKQNLTWPMALPGTMDFAAGPSLGGLLIIVLVGALMAQEYSWRTLQLWLSRGISRPVLLLAKFSALLLPIALIVLVPLVVGGLTTAVFTQLLNGSIPFDQIDWPELFLSAARVAYTLLPYAALTFFLAVVSRSTVVAIGGGVAYTLLIESVIIQIFSFLGGTWATIAQYLPAGLARGLLASNAGLTTAVQAATGGPEYLAPIPAALGIGLYALVFVGLALLVFTRQDLNE